MRGRHIAVLAAALTAAIAPASPVPSVPFALAAEHAQSATAYADVVLADGASAYWRLDEAAGTIAFDSVDGVDALCIGSPGLGTPGLIAAGNDAMTFDGVDDALYLLNSAAMNQGGPYATKSIELWFNADEVNSRQMLYEQGSVTRGLSLYVENGSLYAGVYNTDTLDNGIPWGPVFVSTPISGATTNHAVMVFDQPNDTFSLHVNGALAASDNGIGLLYRHGLSAVGSQRNWSRYHTGGALGEINHFAGTIDEVANYSGALDGATILNHYLTGIASGPIEPTATVTAPAAGSSVTGATTIRVDAIDDDAIGSLDVSISVTQGAVWEPAAWNAAEQIYEYTWDTTAHPDGPLSIEARATDADGNTGVATPVVVTVNNSGALPYRESVLGDGASVYWRFGEVAGPQVVDELGGNHNSYWGGPSLGATGLIADTDAAVTFDGVDDTVRLINSAEINQGGPYSTKSIEVWFRAQNVAPRQVIIEQGSVSRGLNLYLMDGSLHAGIYNTDTYGGATPWGPVFLETAASAATTYHAVMVLDAPNDSFRLYLNGVLVDSAAGVGELYNQGRSAIGSEWDWARFHDGARYGNQYYFDGVLDEIAIYPGALSGATVASHYLAGTNQAAVTPTVAITTPADGTSVAGNVVVEVDAIDDDAAGTLDVEVAIDGGAWFTANWSATTGRYAHSWDTTAHSDGPASIAARATDSDGHTTVAAAVGVTVNNTAPVTIRQQRCQQSLNAALGDPELSAAQKQYLTNLCAGDVLAEAVAEPQGVMAPEIFPGHIWQINEPWKMADRFGHALHCMDTSADRLGLVAMPSNNSGNIDLTKPGGSAPLNYAGEFLLVDTGGEVRLFNRVIFWNVRSDGAAVTIKHQILDPANSPNATVARVYGAPQFVPDTIWTEIDPAILSAYIANMDTPVHNYIIPGRIMNIRTWYDDTYCHDKRAETRIPDLVLDYAVTHGFGGGGGSLPGATRIRLEATGDPLLASSWDIAVDTVSVTNAQYTNGYTWYYAADVS